ncbi:MAG: serine/threonine protein kinase [Candidatus Wallbacteria bacterium]|nr:serine/threonine protein kinase [Candidatus Wallbacteria bacterium]
MRQDIERVIRDPAFEREFKILAREGEGGMGMVLKAIQISLNRTVAVKILLPSLIADEDVAKRLAREAQLTSDLKKHEHIVRLLDFGRVAGLPYVVYEFVEGESLTAAIEREAPMKVPRAIELCTQLLSGLAHAHKHRIIHRDIKPDNVLIDKFNNLKIMDFGIALDESGAERLTREGMIIGTPVYMAPEQAQALGITAQADVYAAGVILYEMLSNRIPWEEDSALGVLAAKVSGKFMPLEEVAPQTPEPLCKLVNRVLDLSPGNRPQGAAAFRKELEAIAASMTGQSMLLGVQEQATEKISTRPAKTSSGPAPSSALSRPAATEFAVQVPPERSPLKPVLAIVLTAMAVAASALAYLRSLPPAKPARGEGKFSFESVAAHYRAGGELAIDWHNAEDVGAEAQIYRADGHRFAGNAEVLHRPMVPASPGRFEAIFRDLDPFPDYSYSISVPGLVHAGEASPQFTLKGIGGAVEELRQAAEKLDVSKLAQAILRARRSGQEAESVQHEYEHAVYDVVTALERFAPMSGRAWANQNFGHPERWALQQALARVQELDWRSSVLDVRLPLSLTKVMPAELLPGMRAAQQSSSECHLSIGGDVAASLVADRPVGLELSRCSPRAGAFAQLCLTVSGSLGRPYFLELALPGSDHAILVRGVDSPGPGAVLCQSFDFTPIPNALSRGITVTLRPMDILTLLPESSGLKLQGAVLRVW